MGIQIDNRLKDCKGIENRQEALVCVEEAKKDFLKDLETHPATVGFNKEALIAQTSDNKLILVGKMTRGEGEGAEKFYAVEDKKGGWFSDPTFKNLDKAPEGILNQAALPAALAPDRGWVGDLVGKALKGGQNFADQYGRMINEAAEGRLDRIGGDPSAIAKGAAVGDSPDNPYRELTAAGNSIAENPAINNAKKAGENLRRD